MTAARNHHVVSQGYLRGFADGTGRQTKVHVIDSAAGRAFRTLVRNVGARRDFNRVEMPDVDANALETVLGEFEGDAVPRFGGSRSGALLTTKGIKISCSI